MLSNGLESLGSRTRDPRSACALPSRGSAWPREKGGFYHDGRFGDLNQVIEHYSRALRLSLSDADKADPIQFLKSL
jgi:hypothetical protein